MKMALVCQSSGTLVTGWIGTCFSREKLQQDRSRMLRGLGHGFFRRWVTDCACPRCVMVNLAEKVSSGCLFEGCDRLVVGPVDAEYRVQICASKHALNKLAGRDQLEFATSLSRRDEESN